MSTGMSNNEYQKIKIKVKSHHTEWSALTVPRIIHITLSNTIADIIASTKSISIRLIKKYPLFTQHGHLHGR